MKKPLVFISYASDEVELADFLKHVLLRISTGNLEVFVAKRDISSGDNPLKVMLDEKLKLADAIIPICSRKAKNTSWVWWESASVWAKTGKIYPLFTNISAGEFGGPLILVVQGKDYFIKDEFHGTLKIVCEKLHVTIEKPDLTEEENNHYIKLEKIYSKNIESAHVELGYDITEQTQGFHRYSLKFAIQNKTDSAFDDVVLELYFPEKYMVRKEWKYSHLHSSLPDDMHGYICVTFEYNNLPENGKKQFSAYLLPGKKLLIFGEHGISNFIYSMDRDRYHDVSKYEVKWNLYINKGIPERGSVQFESLQFF
jgi:hypothetical protein